MRKVRYKGRKEKPEFPTFMTQKSIALALGVTRTRIYAIEKRALRKLLKAITEEAAAAGMTPLQWLKGE